jgi:UDP-glucuronate 4-epimerase
MGMQPVDVLRTYADTPNPEKEINFKPYTKLADGLEKFVEWYKEYYRGKAI